MILKVFTVYDSKAGAYLQPFFTSSIGLAVRSFTDACNTADHNFARYAEDFTLFELGEFDQNTATFTMLKTPTPLGKAIEFVKRPFVVQPGFNLDRQLSEEREAASLEEQFQLGKRQPG